MSTGFEEARSVTDKYLRRIEVCGRQKPQTTCEQTP